MKTIELNQLLGVVLFLMFSCGLVKAQSEWAPIGSEWYFSDPASSRGKRDAAYVVCSSQKDTVLGGQMAKKIAVYNSKKDTIGYEFMYSKNDSVFFWFEGRYHLTYDFSVSVGDTIEYGVKTDVYEGAISHSVIGGDTVVNLKGYITSVVDTLFPGISFPLRMIRGTFIPIHFRGHSWPDFSNKPFSFAHVQRIGHYHDNSTRHLSRFLVYGIYDNRTLTDDPFLRCYNDGEFRFKNPGFGWDTTKSCDFNYFKGVSEQFLESSLALYPKPARSSIHLEVSNGLEIIDLKLYDVLGRLVKKYDASQSQLDVEDLSSGIYFLEIITNKGRLSKKVSIQQ